MLYKYLKPSFQFGWMWIYPLIKFSWHSCSMWDKLGWLNWFWQFLYEGISFFNLKRFYYSYVWSCSLYERRTSFCTGLISRKLWGFLLTFSIGIVCTPFLHGGRGELIIQPNFQKGGLTGPQLLDGVCWERGGYFFQGTGGGGVNVT